MTGATIFRFFHERIIHESFKSQRQIAVIETVEFGYGNTTVPSCSDPNFTMKLAIKVILYPLVLVLVLDTILNVAGMIGGGIRVDYPTFSEFMA